LGLLQGAICWCSKCFGFYFNFKRGISYIFYFNLIRAITCLGSLFICIGKFFFFFLNAAIFYVMFGDAVKKGYYISTCYDKLQNLVSKGKGKQEKLVKNMYFYY